MLQFLLDNPSVIAYALLACANLISTVWLCVRTGKLTPVNLADKNGDGIIDEDVQKLIEYHEKAAAELKEKIQKK